MQVLLNRVSKESNVADLKSTEEDTNLLMKAGLTKKSSVIVVHWVFFIKSESGELVRSVDAILMRFAPGILLSGRIFASLSGYKL